ncbi:hypothetical protein Scep_026157 [Stephania cephalantha]|uniref:Uncharacterized protein n=1 Tax=Stephania cephalantha TaxID=152367 RepID=A0AAP0ERU4_9MAGN
MYNTQSLKQNLLIHSAFITSSPYASLPCRLSPRVLALCSALLIALLTTTTTSSLILTALHHDFSPSFSLLFSRHSPHGFVSLRPCVTSTILPSSSSRSSLASHSSSASLSSLLQGSSILVIQKVKDFLNQQFTIKDLGQAHYFLSQELARPSFGLYVNQLKYMLDLLRDVGLSECKPVATLLPWDCKFDDSDSPLLLEPENFRRLIGRLLYLGFTRPDVTHATQQLKQFFQHLTDPHWQVALHVLKYLKGSPF